MAPRLILLLPSFILLLSAAGDSPCPYLSATTLHRDYQNMLATLKIFIYNNPPNPFNFQDEPAASLFYNSLLHSPFVTGDPDQAHLFFVPFSPVTSTRALGRVVRQIRSAYPYWNRTLGADHFFLSPSGIDYSSDRNVLELKKNAVQISAFPVTSGRFIPHKDVTFPPFINKTTSAPAENSSPKPLLAYLNWDGKTDSDTVNALKSELGPEFLILERPGQPDHATSLSKSKFCLFLYRGDVSKMVEAMGTGCVPVVVVDRPIQDLPLMDVLRWSDMALLARGSMGALKVLRGTSEEKYAEMRGLAAEASRHLWWNEEAKPMDAFHMVMYQLWKRRHVVRYSRREYI